LNCAEALSKDDDENAEQDQEGLDVVHNLNNHHHQETEFAEHSDQE